MSKKKPLDLSRGFYLFESDLIMLQLQMEVLTHKIYYLFSFGT